MILQGRQVHWARPAYSFSLTCVVDCALYGAWVDGKEYPGSARALACEPHQGLDSACGWGLKVSTDQGVAGLEGEVVLRLDHWAHQLEAEVLRK
jgi:hypothetical protein